MKNTSLFLGLLILFPSFVFAKGGPCPLQIDGPVMETISRTGGNHVYSCDYVSQIENLITEIQSFSESKVKVNLLVRRVYDGASFDGAYNIEVPERLEYSGGGWDGHVYGASLYANRAVVAHEYGHALLNEKILKELGGKFPELNEYAELRREISKLDLLALKKPNDEKLQSLLKEKSDAYKNNIASTKYFNLETPYSELYADVVAGYHDYNKGAIFKALFYDEMSDFNYKYIQTRDFDTEFTQRHEKYMSEAHGYFAYTRNYIGKSMWPKNEAEKAAMLKKLGDAIVIELDKLLTEKAELPDFKKGNASLIETLKSLK